MGIWPNPASDYLNINPGDLQLNGLSNISITDLNGHELLNVPFSERVDVSSLHPGMYILIIDIKGRHVGYNRFIKSR
jgi:hypothetical protein